jgi:hypothetical protein
MAGPASRQDRVRGVQHRQLEIEGRGERAECADGLANFGRRVGAIGLGLVERAAPTQQIADLPVARPGTGAAEDEIAEAGWPGQRRGRDRLVLECAGDQTKLGEAPRDQGRARRLAEAQRLGQAGGHRDDALVGTAELDPGDVAALAELERGAREQLAEPARGPRRLARDHRRRRAIAREIRCQRGAAQHRDIAARDLRQERVQRADGGQRAARREPAAGAKNARAARDAQARAVHDGRQRGAGQRHHDGLGAAQGDVE